MKKILCSLSIALIFLSCAKDKCSYDECAYVAPSTEIQALQNYLQANSIAATQHCSGIFYVVNDPGTGKRPTGCSYVTVKYKGTLTNGNVFDETTGNATASFDMGRLIRGFTNGTMQIKSGGKVTIYIPPYLGYGGQTTGSIPANSNLIFTVELLDVQ